MGSSQRLAAVAAVSHARHYYNHTQPDVQNTEASSYNINIFFVSVTLCGVLVAVCAACWRRSPATDKPEDSTECRGVYTVSADSRLHQVLVALSFYATGSYQRLVGGTQGTMMSQQSVSRSIREVTNALNSSSILSKWLKFPQTREQRNIIKQRFYEKFKIPAVIGCIDGTHVAIVRPSQDEHRFYNRKGFHSRNVLIEQVELPGPPPAYETVVEEPPNIKDCQSLEEVVMEPCARCQSDPRSNGGLPSYEAAVMLRDTKL